MVNIENKTKEVKKVNVIVKKLKENIFEKIYFLILCLNVFLLNLFVGSTHDDPKTLLETIIIIEALIFIIISKIKKKDHVLIKGKIDIAVIIMVTTTSIPLIFRKYCSLSDTIDIFIEYLAVYSTYIMVRNIITSEKKKDIFLDIILLGSSLIVIFGIDRLNFNVFQKLYDLTRVSQVSEWRMTSTIGYSNAVFAYIVSLMFIALGKYSITKSKVKSGLYAVYIGLAMYAFYYCNSRAGMVIFALIFVLFLIKIKNKNYIFLSLATVIYTYILVVIFDKIKSINYTATMLALEIFISLLVSFILGILMKKISNNIKWKISKKSSITILIGFTSILILYFFIAQNISEPLKFDSEYGNATIYKIKSETVYIVKLDYTYYGSNPLTMKVFEVDNKRNKKYLYSEVIKESGENLTTEFIIKTDDVDYAMVEFYIPSDSSIILNKLYMDGKEEIVNYKYIPNDIMRLIKTFKMGNISISERISMYKSGLELFKESPIVGNGAKTYDNMFQKVRKYAYTTREVHSYYLDILMDYGIIGITSCMMILAITIYNFIKQKNTKNIINIGIFFGWLLVAIHTIIDFDLAYLLTLTNFFVMIALINEEDNKMHIKNKCIEIATIAVMSIVILLNIFKLPGENLYRKGKYKEAMKHLFYSKNNMSLYLDSKEDDDEENINNKKKILIKYLNNEKNRYQYNKIKLLYNISLELIRKNKIDDGIEGIEAILNLIENDKVIIKYDCIDKYKWDEFIKKFKDDIEQIDNQIYNEKIKNITYKIDRITR